MGKNFKKGFGIALGVASAFLVAYAAKLIVNDINNMVDETSEFDERAKKWFKQKKEYFKGLIDEKNMQIAEISDKLKEDVIKEIDDIKRKALIEKATQKIAILKDDIKDISAQRRREFIYFLRKMNASAVADFVRKAGVNIKKSASETFTCKKPPMTDMDFEVDFDIDIDDEDID
ncbi:MAG: hypothetical protein LBM38_03055 [Clostridiales bacterium]|jgi:hypothetical protein|nr:hypothetical protein [Clostridiales bacterium]